MEDWIVFSMLLELQRSEDKIQNMAEVLAGIRATKIQHLTLAELELIDSLLKESSER